MLEGFGGNVTVAVGDDGVIMVDDQFAPMHDKLKAAIAAHHAAAGALSSSTRIITATTPAATQALSAKDGATIVAHENVRKRLDRRHARTTCSRHHNAAGTRRTCLPTKTYTDAMTLEIKGRVAQLTHIRPTPTPTATPTCISPTPTCLATGDTFGNGRYPNSDFMQRRQHQRRHRGGGRLSRTHQRRDPNRARARAARQQGATRRLPRLWSPPRASAWRR